MATPASCCATANSYQLPLPHITEAGVPCVPQLCKLVRSASYVSPHPGHALPVVNQKAAPVHCRYAAAHRTHLVYWLNDNNYTTDLPLQPQWSGQYSAMHKLYPAPNPQSSVTPAASGYHARSCHYHPPPTSKAVTIAAGYHGVWVNLGKRASILSAQEKTTHRFAWLANSNQLYAWALCHTPNGPDH